MKRDGSKDRARSSGRVVEVLSTEEIAAVQGVVEKGGAPTALLIYLMMYAGLRAGECVKLRWENVMLDSSPLQVIDLTKEITKTGIPRQVPMNSLIARTLTRVFDTWLQIGLRAHPSDWLFPSPGTNNHITVRAVEKQVSKVGHYALGRHIRPHVLRHTFADQLRRVTDIRTVQNLLGHVSVTSTQIYTHPTTQDGKDAIEKAFNSKVSDRGLHPS